MLRERDARTDSGEMVLWMRLPASAAVRFALSPFGIILIISNACS